MGKKILISIFVFASIFVVILSMYFTSPTKAEVERFFAENRCELQNISALDGGEQFCVHYLRRHSNLVWGQINSIEK